jgi:DNA mismatch repair protein MutS2
MVYPEQVEQKIGFDQIRTLLKEKCQSSLGSSWVDKLQFSTDFKLLDKLLGQTREFISILSQGEGFPGGSYRPLNPYLSKAKIEGSHLQADELHQLKLSIQTLADCLKFFKGKEDSYPNLTALTIPVWVDPRLVSEINKILDESGNLRDDASSELQLIRKSLISELSRARRTLDKILKAAIDKGYTNEGVELTIRNGRLVIPVLAEYKRSIKGFIQDESATGQTVFLEPAEVLEINNEVRELQLKERREIIRILTRITDLLRPNLESLRKGERLLAQFDFIRAKALLAIDLNAVVPPMVSKARINWQKAVHPLLYLSHVKQNKPVVPLSISLTKEKRILVISGPNAGGKSVTLKTVALLQYMIQCGLAVPLDEASEVGMFQNLFIDIGDEQSLENDLSTYSSHLTNMRYFLRAVNKKTLFLIDEFGTGTEPRIGGAIAEAILQNLYEQGGWGIINTHYGNLKQLAEDNPGIFNGAMRYDVSQLEPLYELELGRPGSSFALEIAKKIGLPKEVLAHAQSLAGEEQVRVDKLLAELEEEKKNLQELRSKTQKQEHQARSSMKHYSELKAFLESRKNELLREAKLEARSIISSANRDIENTIREIKESQADKHRTKSARAALEKSKSSLEIQPEEKPQPSIAKDVHNFEYESGPISVGDAVQIKGQNAVGEVVDLKGKDVEVLIGALKTKTKLNKLQKISKKAFRTIQREASVVNSNIHTPERRANFNTNIDVRGLRTDEALKLVDELLDNASMFGTPEVRIVHGKGNGILREQIRAHLRSYSIVKSYQDEHADRGGPGVSIVQLKA